MWETVPRRICTERSVHMTMCIREHTCECVCGVPYTHVHVSDNVCVNIYLGKQAYEGMCRGVPDRKWQK